MFKFYPAGSVPPAIVLLLALVIFSGCQQLTETNQTAENTADGSVILPDNPDSFDVPAPNLNLANPLVISQQPDDVALCAKVNETIEKSPAANARWGVFVVSLRDGRVVCSREGRKLFNPASIQKTLTAIVALDKLGPDFRWKTSVYAQNQIGPDGTLDGDLVLYGEGAPDFDSAALESLVTALHDKGLRRVRGSVVGDSSYFRGETIGDGWTWNELQWYYGAEAPALTFNENQAFINVENGSASASTDYIQVTVGQQDGDAEAPIEASGIKRGLENNDFYVWGSVKNFGARVSVHNPPGLAAKNFKEELEKKGITIEGGPRSRDWKSADRLDPAGAVELASVPSRTLAEIVRKMNKNSVNLYAELILRTIGKRFGDTVPGAIQRPQNVRGDDTAGAAVMKRWLAEHHVATDEIQIYDGSGLSRLDFVTPEAFTRALIYAAQSPFAPVFTDSLPIAGVDGTLGGRLARVKGKVLAKTGSIMFVNSLAGYADNVAGEVLAFAVVSNNDTRKGSSLHLIDSIATILVTGEANGKAEEEKPANQNRNVNANKINFVLERQGKN